MFILRNKSEFSSSLFLAEFLCFPLHFSLLNFSVFYAAGGTGLGDKGLQGLSLAVASHPGLRVVGLSGILPPSPPPTPAYCPLPPTFLLSTIFTSHFSSLPCPPSFLSPPHPSPTLPSTDARRRPAGNGLSKAGGASFLGQLGACSVESVVLAGNGFTQADAAELQGKCRQGLAVKVA